MTTQTTLPQGAPSLGILLVDEFWSLDQGVPRPQDAVRPSARPSGADRAPPPQTLGRGRNFGVAFRGCRPARSVAML